MSTTNTEVHGMWLLLKHVIKRKLSSKFIIRWNVNLVWLCRRSTVKNITERLLASSQLSTIIYWVQTPILLNYTKSMLFNCILKYLKLELVVKFNNKRKKNIVNIKLQSDIYFIIRFVFMSLKLLGQPLGTIFRMVLQILFQNNLFLHQTANWNHTVLTSGKQVWGKNRTTFS